MTFLRGKSTTYTRYQIPVPVGDLAGKIGLFNAIEAGDESTESFGTCSYRSLLDGPVDAGYLGGGDIYVIGLRYDRKKAPGQLVQAITARELYDASVVGKVSKKDQALIKAEVRLRLDREAMPKPTHGMLAADSRKGTLYLDGPAGASAHLTESLGMAPIYAGLPEYRKFLAWMAWRGVLKQNRDSEQAVPWGGCSFTCHGEGAASFTGEDIGELLKKYLPMGWELTRCGFMWSVDGEVATIVLDSACLKVTLTFPEEVLKAEMPPDAPEGMTFLDWKLANRMAFISRFEAALAYEVTEFLRREAENMLEPDFEGLFNGEGQDAMDLPCEEGPVVKAAE